MPKTMFASTPGRSCKGPSFFLCWIILAATAAFASGIPGDFVWIDHVEIEQGGYRLTRPDDLTAVWTLTLDQFLERREGMPPSQGGYWRPVYALSLTLDWALWQKQAWLYHLENIGWHLLVCCGLFLLGNRLMAHQEYGRQAVFWATLLFAVHPLGMHSVTWISGRKDTLCAAFALGALLSYAQLGRRTTDWRSAPAWLLLSVLCLLLAVLSKELGFVVPLVALLLFYPRPGGAARPQMTSPAIVGMVLLWAVAGVLALYRVWGLGGFGLNARYPADTLTTNVATASTLWWHYIWQVLQPWNSSISDAWPVARNLGPVEGLAMLGWVATLMALVWGLKQRRVWVIPLLWYLIWTLPTSGIVPLRHFRAERYLYPASWGLLLLVTLVAATWWPRMRVGSRGVRKLIPVVAVMVLLLTTAYRNTFWQDDTTLFTHSATRHPQHAEAWLALAKKDLDQRNYSAAIANSHRAIAAGQDTTYTGYWSPFIAYTNLGLALYYTHQLTDAEIAFGKALEHRPHNAVAHYHAGLVSFALGRLDEARIHYAHSLKIMPGDFLCRSNLAATLLRLGKIQQAVVLLRALVEERPEDVLNRTNFASALILQDRFAEAEPHFARLVRQQRNQPLHRVKLAWCQWENGKPEAAKQNFFQARKQLPGHPAVAHVGKLLTGEP